jgi:hypothetical protein
VLAVEKAKKELAGLLGEAVEVLRESMRSEDRAAAQAAARSIMAKVLPDQRTPGNYVNVPELADPDLSLEAKAQVLARYLGEGRITAEQFQTLTRSLESTAKLVDLERVQAVLNLVKAGKLVHEAIAEVENRGAHVTH